MMFESDFILSLTIFYALAFIIVIVAYIKLYTCAICRKPISDRDRMFTGRVRYRLKNTDIPVCSKCGHNHGDKVE